MARPVSMWGLAMAIALASFAVGADAPSAGPDPGAAQGAGPYPPISFSGRDFELSRAEPTASGWAAYYTSDLWHPDVAEETIVVNHMTEREVGAREPPQVASALLDHARSRGGTVVSSFTAPDKATRSPVYCAVFYYIYGGDGYGDVWMSRVTGSAAGPLGVLYRRTIKGPDAAGIESRIKAWIEQNVAAYGHALGDLAVPAQPAGPPFAPPAAPN